jgi:hypothetical protein
MIGKTFGQLTVIERGGTSKNGHILWNCLCVCGNERTVFGSNLKRGNTVSCGCFDKERKEKHGGYRSREYQSWRGMIQRCTNPKAKGYEYYGGRGIAVCDEWLNSFQQFLNDMGPRPKYHTLDRIKGDDHYYKENCRWALIEIQMKNRRPWGTQIKRRKAS